MRASHFIGCSAQVIRDREAALEAFNRHERRLGSRPSPADAVTGVGWLYELLPPEARYREPDVSGIQALRGALVLLPADFAR